MNNYKILKVVFGVSGVLLLSKVFGFLREMFMAKYYGVSMEADAFQVASVIPVLLYSYLILGSIQAVFVPVFLDIKEKRGHDDAINFTRNLATLTVLLSLIVLLITELFAPGIVKLIAPKFQGEKLYLTVKLLRLLLPLIFWSTLFALFNAFLNANKNVVIPLAVWIPGTVVIILAMLLFAGKFGIMALTIGWIVGYIVQTLVLMYFSLKKGFSFTLRPSLRDPDVSRVLKLMLPLLLSSAVTQAQLVIDRIMASGLPTGSISALNYANKLNNFTYGIFAAAVSVSFFPSFSELWAREEKEEFIRSVTLALRSCSFVLIPMMIGLTVLREPIITVLFKRGAFDDKALYMTSVALLAFGVGIVAIGMKEILNRAFYSLQDTKTPTINAAIAVVANIGLNLIFVKRFAHAGLALGTSIATILTSIMLTFGLRKRLGRIGGREIFISFTKSLVAGGVMAITAQELNIYYIQQASSKFQLMLSLFGTIGISAMVYFGVAYLIKCEEMQSVDLLIKRFRKNKETMVSPTKL